MSIASNARYGSGINKVITAVQYEQFYVFQSSIKTYDKLLILQVKIRLEIDVNTPQIILFWQKHVIEGVKLGIIAMRE